MNHISKMKAMNTQSELTRLRAELDAAHKENQEQARLLGISGSVEAHLLTQRQHKTRQLLAANGDNAKLRAENAALRADAERLAMVATMAKSYMETRKFGHGIEDPLWHEAKKALDLHYELPTEKQK